MSNERKTNARPGEACPHGVVEVPFSVVCGPCQRQRASDPWVPSVGDRVIIGGTSLIELRGRAGVVRDVRGREALVELSLPEGLGAMRTDWLFFEQIIPDRSHDPRPNEARDRSIERIAREHEFEEREWIGRHGVVLGHAKEALRRVIGKAYDAGIATQRPEPASPQQVWLIRHRKSGTFMHWADTQRPLRCAADQEIVSATLDVPRRERATRSFTGRVVKVDLDDEPMPSVTVRAYLPEDALRSIAPQLGLMTATVTLEMPAVVRGEGGGAK